MSFASKRQQISFLNSANEYHQLPDDIGIEVAFCGRSNAGKSSALNTLVGQRQLARVSKTPGRTQLINTFTLSDEHRLIDLPGYGFAKVPVKMRQHWDRLLSKYFFERKSLKALILLMDVRHPMTELDQQFVQFAEECQIRTHILLTKADKLKHGKAMAQLHKTQKQLPEDDLLSVQLFSALKRQGVDEVYTFLDGIFGYSETAV